MGPQRRVHRWLCLALLLAPCGGTAIAQVTDALRRDIAWQAALEREGFSPGIIDGKIGRKTTMATQHFQRHRGLPQTGQLDAATAEALAVRPDAALGVYRVQPEDQAKVVPVPTDWNAKARMQYLGYESLLAAVAERFHCSKALLATLNPGVNLETMQVGQELVVPVVHPPQRPALARLEISMDEKVIRGFDADGRVVALFHCSIAADVSQRPRGEARITGIAENPTYSFDPKMWPEVHNVNRRLLIAPGPRNPVGLCWIALSRQGYGIHGTPQPEMIGKTGSHGCFRLTNWDALRLGTMVRAGVPVRFVP